MEYDYDNGNHNNKTMKERLFKQWKTTLVAIIVAITSGLSWEHGQELGGLIVDALAFIALLIAKDK